MKRILLAVFFLTLFRAGAKAQKPLPDFSAVDLGKNKVQISWANPFDEGLIQLNVQVSYDSAKFYKTIFLFREND